jgi:hypothetical protein
MLASPAHAAHVTKAHVSPPQHKQVSLAALAAGTALLTLYAAPIVSGRCETVVAVCKVSDTTCLQYSNTAGAEVDIS